MKFPAEPLASAAPPSASAIARLRLATRERHSRIDRLMDLRRMREPVHYGRVLLAFDSFLGPWEHGVAAALPARWHGWLHERSRRYFLQDDLTALSLSPLGAPAPAIARLDGSAAAWGSLYVMEGSALGGQVITRALAAAGVGPGRGASYFHGWGDDTQAIWQEFLALLESELATPARIAVACAAACDTFDALSAHLDDLLHERAALA